MIGGKVKPRERLIGYYAEPGTLDFKIMVRTRQWKYIFMANGGREQLFDMQADPQELHNQAAGQPEVARALRREAVAACRTPGAAAALLGDDLRALPFTKYGAGESTSSTAPAALAGFPRNPQMC